MRFRPVSNNAHVANLIESHFEIVFKSEVVLDVGGVINSGLAVVPLVALQPQQPQQQQPQSQSQAHSVQQQQQQQQQQQLPHVGALGGGGSGKGGSNNATTVLAVDNSGDIAKIEAEFRDLKEKYFREQVAKLKREIDEIKAGTHVEFVSQLAELEKARSTKLSAAQAWRQFKLTTVQNEFETDKKIADDEFMEEKRQHRDRLINGVMERKKAISEEKSTMSLGASDAQVALGSAALRNKRTLRRRVGPEKEDGPTSNTTHAPPTVRYTLTDQEAALDIASIRAGAAAAVNSGAGGSGAVAAVDVSSIFVKGDVGVARGVLRYHETSFQVGDNVVVKADTNGGSTWTGSIVFISPVEVHVQCAGNKCRFPVEELRRGTYRVAHG